MNEPNSSCLSGEYSTHSRSTPRVPDVPEELRISGRIYRRRVHTHRALLPVAGYYEWNTGPNTKKTPFYIHSPNDELLALAGVYSWWKDHSAARSAHRDDLNVQRRRRAPEHL